MTRGIDIKFSFIACLDNSMLRGTDYMYKSYNSPIYNIANMKNYTNYVFKKKKKYNSALVRCALVVSFSSEIA